VRRQGQKQNVSRILFSVLSFALGLTFITPANCAVWREYQTGFRTLDITAGPNSTLWVCGSDASIAVSKDSGAHWEIRDRTKNAGLFLLVRFRDSFGYAVGTTGFVAFTTDGGLTWQHAASPYTDVLAASFSDSSHGLIRTRSGVFQTTDGKTWISVSERYSIDFNKYPYVLSVAALDAKHMAIHLSEPPPSGSGFLYTKDGGVSWALAGVPNSTITSMLIQGGQYWAIGTEVVHKDKPGGGYAVPLLVSSSDGETWQHSANDIQMCHWEGCGGRCTDQGCLAGAGLVLSTFEKEGSRIVFPSNPDFTLKWAISASTICFVGSQLECTDTRIDPAADASKMPGTAPPAADAQPLVKTTSANTVQCIACGLQSVYVDPKANGRYTLKTTLIIDKNGLVNSVEFQDPPSTTLADSVRRSMMRWIFLPLLKDGSPVDVRLNTAVNVVSVRPR
jgi:hypothetical protein